MTHIAARIVGATVSCCLLVAGGASVLGESGSVDRAPRIPVPRSGLRIQVDSRGGEGNGYRPVKVEVSSSNGLPFGRNRTLRLTLQQDPDRGPLVEKSLTLDAANTTESTTVLVPQSGAWHHFVLRVLEGDSEIRELRIGGGKTQGVFSEALPTTLLIDSDSFSLAARDVGSIAPQSQNEIPDLSRLVTIAGWAPKNDPPLTLIENTDFLALLKPLEVPGDWLALSCYDFVLISLDDLRLLREVNPAGLEALLRWNRTGTSLCVFGAGDEFEHLPDLDKLLAFSLAQPNRESPKSKWREPPAELYEEEFHALENSRTDERYTYDRFGNPVPVETKVERVSRPETPPFRLREHGLGMVAAFSAEDPSGPTSHIWGWLFASLGTERWQWVQRHGVSLVRNNNDYWNFLIDGVGLPPTITFRLLITGFVVLIGPVNFMVLRKLRRPYLMLLVVPAAALLVTGGLIGYALVADGLGTRVRTRSVTLLDQSCGEAVVWGRQTYYAGLAPSGGLTYEGDTAVFPVRAFQDTRKTGGEIAWHSDGRQQFRQGFLASRTLAQFLLVRATPSDRRLTIRSLPGGGAAVHNRLGVPVRYLLVVGDDGAVSSLSGLADDATGSTTPGDEWPQIRRLADAVIEQELATPSEYYNASYYNYNWRNYYSMGWDYQLPEATFETSVLERRLAAIRHMRISDLEPRTYYAIVETSPELPLGLPRVGSEEGFHVILGNW